MSITSFIFLQSGIWNVSDSVLDYGIYLLFVILYVHLHILFYAMIKSDK